MALQSFTFSPVGGVNGEINPRFLPEDMCQDSSNFLFERGCVCTRPGASKFALANFTDRTAEFAESFYFGEDPKTVIVARQNATPGTKELWTVDGVTATNRHTFSASSGARRYNNAASVNGVILVGNSKGGLVRYLPPSTVTEITAAKYRFVQGHLSRAIAAYDITSGSENPRKFAWSVTGDETDWTSTNLGAGSLVLNDAPDDITALGVIHNVVMIGRREGIHLAYPTGQSQPAFRTEVWLRKGVGVFYPSTFFVDLNTAYFVGQDDVYKYNLVRLEPFGAPIRRELFDWLNQGIFFTGFVSRSFGKVPRAYYNLSPTTGATMYPTGVPHFQFDIVEQRWSRHNYDFIIDHALHRKRDGYIGPAFISGGLYYEWNADELLEREARLTSKTFILGREDREAAVERVLVSHRARDVAGEVDVAVECMQQEEQREVTDGKQVAKTSGNRWQRTWFNNSVRGQNFNFKITVPPSNTLEIDALTVLWSEHGAYQSVQKS